MNLLPLTNPTWGLSISEDAVCLVEVQKGWNTRRFKQVKRVALPQGVVKLSSAKSNLLQPPEFIETLRLVSQPIKPPLPIALSLPDLCARSSIFEFSKFPKKTKEQVALLNWRFQQDLKLDTSRSRLAYGVYVPFPRAESPAPANPDQVQVLGTAIRNDIVEEFEQACLQAELLPVSIGISGLDIFDLHQPFLQEMLETLDRRRPGSFGGGMFLYVSGWGFSFLAFKDGCPQFIRTKAIAIRPTPATVENNPDPSGFQEVAIDGNPYPPSTTAKVTKEILATIQYYLETFPCEGSPPTTINLFVAADVEHGATLLPSSDHIHETLKACGWMESALQVTQFSPNLSINTKKSRTLSEFDAGAALPGFARLRVA